MRKVSNTNRLLSLVLCICMVLSMMPGISLPVFAADAVSYVDYTWNEETGVLSSETKSVTEYTEVTESTTSMSNGWYVVNGEITISSRITVTGTVHLILVDGAHLTASSGITVNEGNSLYIYAQSSDESTMGKLTAASSTSDATIGGLYKNHAGIIEINGGNINTSMTGSGACIGSSWACGGYHITINGGKVTATNSRGNGAAIGSGDRANMANSQGSVHSITINGGVVNATVEKNSGAAIGGGLLFSGGDITITGGTIVAKTSSRGAAIGGGEQGDGGNITITGGTVVAKNTNSGRGSAGIGGGYQGSGGNITITGGNVTAVGGWGAAGIGGYANAGNIVITGGTINSTGNVRACGIGGGVAGVNGSIAILTSDVKITQGASGKGNIGFGENNNGTGSTMLLDGNTVTVSGAYTLPVDYIIPEGTTLCISSGASLTIPNGLTLTNNGTITVEEGGSLINNDVFVQNGVFTNNGTFTCAHSVITDDWTSENGKHYKECLSGCGTKLEEECSGGVADCLQAGICEVCGEDYIPIDPDNHVSEDTYIEYIDDTNHGLYHTCCQALIEQIAHTPAEGQEATCVGVATCAECGIAYGGNDTTNHASDETKYISNGNGTHILTHACCGNPAAEPESHKVTYTVNGEFTIDAVCKDCGATGSATFAPTAGGTYNGCVFASSYSATGILNGWNAFTKPVITGCCEGGCKNAGEHTVTMTLGDQSVSATFTVARKTLTISEVKAHYKSYDGTSDLNIYSASLGGVVVYDEGDYDGEWDDVRDDVKLVYDDLVYTLEGVVPGYYDTVNVSGVTITGSDASNYGIAESFEDVPLLDSMGHDFKIHNATVLIDVHDQLLTGDAELDQSQYSVEGLEDQFTLQGVSLYENSYSEIEIDPYSISIYLDGEDVTEYFDITVHNGNLSRVCEGHEYDENGFCATGECSSYEPAVKSQTVDEWGSEIEVYDIYNAGQLYWFAEQVNTYGNNYINGRLMTDITVNEDLTAENLRQWTPIGKDWPTYCGMFEGNDYTISGLYVCDPEMDYVGLFGYTDYAYPISNIHLTNSYFEGNSYIGGLFGYAGSNISGCTVSDSVTVKGNSYLGGIAGGTSYGELNNSWSAATVAANENGYSYGGLVGNNSLSINNCYTTESSLVGANNDSYGGSLNNSYYLSEEETEDGGKTAAQFASGEVAYLLQSGVQSEDIYDDEGNFVETVTPEIWGQTIGTEEIPALGGETVYKVLDCDGTTELYSNTNENKPHGFDDKGFCPNCDAYEPAVLNGDVYEISNAGQLYWFAAKVNGGETAINGKLIADIVVNEGTMTAETTGARAWTPIGNSNAQYTGTFDGNNKTVSGLYFSDTNADYAGLFGYLGESGKVQNVGVVNFYFHGNYWVGGVIGMSHYDTIITGCYSTGTVSGYSYVGGVVGDNAGTITDCYSTGTVSGYSDYGYVGGVTGLNFRGTVTNCYSTAVVSGNEIVGGVVADNYEGTVTNCYSTGTVSGNERVGGVVGSNAGTITDCYSTGTVSGNERVGGVVGQNTVLSTGNDSVVTNCYFNSDMYTGAAAGYNDGTVTSVEGKTTAQFASGEVAYLLSLGATVGEGDSAVTYPGDIWGQTIGTEEIPTLGGSKVYQIANTGCPIYGEYSYSNDENGTYAPDHSFPEGCNGFCPNCDAYEPAVLNGDVYEISNAGQLYWFAAKVNGSETGINGKLMADIVVNEGTMTAETTGARVWTPIGNSNAKYTGTFDGNDKTVSGLYFNDAEINYVGLFGYVGEGGKVQNVGVVNACFIGKYYVGGVVGMNDGTVTNCYNTGTVSGNDDVGGVVGQNWGTIMGCYNTGIVSGQDCVGGLVGSNDGTVTNCYNTGTVSGNDDVGGVVGSNDGTVTNCYNTGTVSGNGDVGGVVGTICSTSTVTNCYFNNEVSIDTAIGWNNGTAVNVEGKTTAQFASGEVAYLLGEAFGQNIDNGGENQGYPVFSDATVYRVLGKDGASDTYTNTNPCNPHDFEKCVCTVCGVREHQESAGYENGICTNCDAYEPAVLNGDVYEISNAGQLYWFAAKVNGGETAINGKLIADIVVNEGTMTAETTGARAWTLIGNYKAKYTGTFDGSDKTVSGLYFNDAEIDYVGLFGYVGEGGKVQNVGVVDAYFSGQLAVGGVVGINHGTVTGCYSTGTVSGRESVGGVVGWNYGTVTNCYSTGTVTGNQAVGGVIGSMHAATATNCYSTGTVTGNQAVGGVVGSNSVLNGNKSVVINCYFNSDVSIDTAIGRNSGTAVNVEGKTTAQFASGEVAYLLGEAFGQNIDNGGENQRYPVFSDATVYRVLGKDGASDTYTNTNPCNPHDFEKCVCTVCGAREHQESAGYGENGFCPNCDAYEPAVLNGDVYEISNAGQLYWFAAKVNGGETAINGELIADIVVNEGTMTAETTGARAWTPIGNNKAKYTGTFDGNNKTVSGLYYSDTNADYAGLFGYLGESGKVQNVGVVNAYFCGTNYVGGVMGWNDGTVTNCYSTGTVSGNWYVGGVMGWNYGTVTNCYNTGTVSGNDDVGGVVGWNSGTVTNCYNTGTVSGNSHVGGVVGGSFATVMNCYNTGTVSGNSHVGGVVGWNYGTVTNCYFLSETEDNYDGTTAKTAEQFASGEVAYLLSLGTTVGEGDSAVTYPGDIWGQTIGTEEIPTLGGETVYKVLDCDGTTEVYSNTNENKTHSFDDKGFCSNCDAYEPAVLNGDWYEISNAGQLYWFAQQVNSGNGNINGKLMADIVVNENVLAADGSLNEGDFRPWIMMGDPNNYLSGTFDGQGHTVSGLYCDHSSETDYITPAFITNVVGGTVRNVGLVDSYIRSSWNYAGGVVGGTHKATVENCWNEATVIGVNGAGGIVGCAGTNTTVRNCYNTGTILSNERKAAGILIAAGSGITLKNCYNTGTVQGTEGSNPIADGGLTLENSYYLADSETDSHDGTTAKTAEAFASGEVAWLLQADQQSHIWGQTCGTGLPALGGPRVYGGYGDCQDTEFVYSNDPDVLSGTPISHTYVNGFCTNTLIEGTLCGAYQEAQIVDGVYQIGNAGQLFWFAQQVNDGNKGANAVLTADIDLEGRNWTPICSTGLYYNTTEYADTGYTGTFDGQGHVISNLTATGSAELDASYGLFGTLSGTVKNLGIRTFTYTGAGMDSRVGSVVGQMLDGSLVENCFAVNVNINTQVNTQNGVAGGIAGCNYAGIVRNCFTDNVTITAGRYGGILGDNCADGNNSDGTDRPGTMDNCYTSHIYLRDPKMLGNAPSGEAGVSAEWFASGEIAYLLGEAFGQNIDNGGENEGYPVFSDATVYKVIDCDGITEIYSNTNANKNHIPSDDDGDCTTDVTCSVCGQVAIPGNAEHSWQDADCTEPKTCTVCGATEGEALGHKDEDNSGRCDLCNCLMQPAKLCMVSISLKGNIALNYYMLLSDEVLSDSTAYMQFTMADGEIVKIPVSQGVQTVRSGETYYVFSCAVDAKEMTDDVISQFFYDGGSTKEHTYSVQTYADHILANSSNEDMKELVKAMLNYGAASQIHFGYNTDKLANAGLEAPDYSNVTISGFNAIPGQGTELAKFYSASLILKSETTLRFFFTAPITAAYNGQELEVKQRGSLYYVDVVGIAAKDLDENVTITINDGTNTADVTYNPMAYCAAVLNDTTGAFDQEMKDVVSALYLYNQAANIYFKEN